MPDAAWKSLERWVAEYFGGRRSWKEQEDVEHEAFSIECKLRASLPKWLKDAMAQAARNAAADKLPILLLHEKGKRREDAIVCIPASCFREWYA